MRALPSWVKGFIYSFLCIFTLAQSGFGQSPASASAFGKLPLSFEPNQGQTAGEVQFLSRGRGYTLFLSSSDSVLALHRGHRGSRAERMEAGPSADAPAALRMHLVGANPSAQGVAEDALPGKSNYFIGNDRSKWRTDVPNYGRVRYRGVYPGIDLVYYGNQRLLEHDFEVAPGADPRRIRLAFEGIQRAEVEKSGDLVLQLADGEVRLQKPVIYQNTEQGRREVTGGFALRKNQVTIQVGAYDRRRALVIDPILSYSTYLGGTGEDAGGAVATDSSGNVYVVGLTASTAANGFPITTQLSATGCAAVTPAGCSGTTDDVFIVKINPAGSGGTTGTALVYSTFLGGNGDDEGYGISVDGSNNAYVTGFTSSTDFPPSASPAPYQPTIGSFQGSAFVTKIGAAGNTLLYSTYLGGHARDWGNAITQDSGGNIYVTGVAFSRDFPTLSTLSAPPVTLFASRNSGTSWVAASGSTSFQVTAFAVDRNTPGTVYAGQVGSGVIKSTDFGATWTATVATQSYSNALVLDPTTTGAAAVLYEGSRFNGVRKITGGGTGSTFINSGLTSLNVLSLVLDPANSATLYAGLNGGGVWVTTSANGPTPTWTQVTTTGLGDQTINALAFDPATHALYAGTNNGVYQLANGAARWTTVAGGPTGLAVLALSIDSSSNVYAASFGGGLFKLSAGAWTTLNGSGGTALGTLNLRAVAVDPVTPSTIYAAGRSRLGIYKSTDGGSTWSLLNSGLTITSAQTLAIDPASTANVYAGMVNLMTFVAKFNSGGSPTVLAFFGGASGSTQPYTMAVDDPTSQNMYIGGSTSSASLPTPLVGQTTIGGNTDGFVAKISTVGTPAVVWDRYLGGAFDDIVFSLALDQNRNVDVTGYTTSADFPVSAGAYQTSLKVTPNFGANAFVSEIDPTGATLLYSTYFGGTGGDDEGTGIAVVSAGNVASINVTAAGSGYSSTTPPAVIISGGGGSGATATAVVSPASGQVTGFAAINPGSGYVLAPTVGIALPSGPGTPATAQAVLSSPLTPLISVAGLTVSTDLPTVNAMQPFNAGGYDTFYAKFDPSKIGTTALLYSTYLGGNGDDFAFFVNNLALDSVGAAWITGQTFSTNFPTTASSAVQPAGSSTVANSGDAFVYKIQTTGNASDISLSMSSGAGTTPAEGTTYTYSIVVTDNGPNPAGAPSVVVSGTFPTNLTVNSVIPGQGTCSGLQTFTCSLGTVAFPGGGVNVTVNVTANTLATPPIGPTLTATVQASTTDDDPVPANNVASTTVTVQRRADLTITGISSPASVANGTAFNYSVTAANNGPSTATGIIVSYPLPASVTFNQGASTAGCALSAGTVTCPVVNLTPFSSTVIVINVTPHLAGSLSATFTVSSSQVVDDGPGGGPGANNTPPPFTLTVRSNVNLSVTLATTSPVVPVGGSAAFNITVTNNGTDTATGVSFTGSSPTGLSYVGFSSSSAGVSCSAGGQVTCTLPDIPSLGTVSFTIFASAALQGTYVANASVSSSVTDANPSDNTTSTTVTVTGALNSNLTTLLTDYETSTVRGYNTSPGGGQVISPILAGANPSNVVIAPNGRLAFTGNVNGSYISVVDLTIQAEIARIRDVGGWSIAITSDGQKLVSVSSNRDELDVVDIATLAVTRISLDGKVGDAAGVNDIHPFSLALVGYQAYIANDFGPVMVVNFATPGSPIISTVAGTAALLALHAGHQVAATPNGSTVAVFDRLKTGGSALVYLISTSTNTLSQTVTMTFGGARTIAITRNPNAASGVVAFLGFSGGAIRVLDLRSGSATYGQLLTGSVALGSPVTDMALTPDGNTLQAVNGVFQGSTGPPGTLYTLNAGLIATSPSTALVSTVVIPNSISVRGLAIGYVQNSPLPGAPQVTDVVPQEITNEAAKLVSIFGDNFAPGALVRIGSLDPLLATFVSPQAVTVTVPAGAAVQLGGIVVTLPNTAGGPLAANVSGSGSNNGAMLRISPPPTFAPSHPVAVSVYGVPKLSLLFRDSALLPAGLFSPSVAISPDGLYAYSGETEVDITNLDTQQSLPPILGPTSGFGTQTFSDCASGSDNYAIAPDPTTGKKVLYLVSCDAATESSDTLYFVDVDPTSTTTRNTLLARTIQAAPTDFYYGQGLAVTPDGRYVYSVDTYAGPNGTLPSRLVIFDVLNNTSTIIPDITTLGADPGQFHIHVTPDGHSLLLSGTGGSSIKVYDIQGANALLPLLVTTITGSGAPQNNPPLLYWFQVVGTRLFAYASDQSYVQVFNFDRSTPNFAAIGSYTIPNVPGRSAGSAMAVTPEGTLIYAVMENEDAVAVLDANLVAASSPNALITKIRTGINPINVAISPRGNASADLEPSIDTSAKFVSPNTAAAAVNQPFDVFIKAYNNGPSAATGVTMTLPIPAGVQVNSAFITFDSSVNISCSITTTQVTCPVGNLRLSDVAEVDINVTATALGSYTFTNTVSGNETDPNPANNAATLNVSVANGADLAITGSASPNPAVAGSPDTATVVVTNNGPDVASAVTASFSSTSHSPTTFTTTQGTCTQTPTICSLGNILPGGQVTITFTTTYVASDASADGTVTISGSVLASTADPNFRNNSFTLVLPITNPSAGITNFLVTELGLGQLRIFNPSTNTPVGQPTTVIATPVATALSPNRRLAFVASLNVNAISVADLSIQKEIYRIRGLRAANIAITADGTRLVAPLQGSDSVAIIDAATFQVLQTVNLNGLVGDSTTVGDILFGGMVMVGSKAYIDPFAGAATAVNPVVVIDASAAPSATPVFVTGVVGQGYGGNRAHSTIAATPDGQYVLDVRNVNACGNACPLQIISTSSNSVVGQVLTATGTAAIVNTGSRIAISPSNPNGVFGYYSQGARLRVIDLRPTVAGAPNPNFGKVLATPPVSLPFGPVYLSVSSDGNTVYATNNIGLSTSDFVSVSASLLQAGAPNPILAQLKLGAAGIRAIISANIDALPETGTPQISSVQPMLFFNDTPTTLTISGSGFASDTRVKVGTLDSTPVTFISSSQVQVTIPAGAPAQSAVVIVTNPNSAGPITAQWLSGVAPASGIGNGNSAVDISAPLTYQPKFEVVASNLGDGTVSRLLHKDSQPVAPTPMGIAFAPDGSEFFTESWFLPEIVAAGFNTSPTIINFDPTAGAFQAGQQEGIAVALNPATGQPVAFAASATFDSNTFTYGEQLNLIDANPFSPSYNTIIDSISAPALNTSSSRGALAATPDGLYVYENAFPATTTTGSIVVFNVAGRSVTSLDTGALQVAPFQSKMVVTTDKHWLLMQDIGGSVRVFDISSAPTAPASVGVAPAFTPTGKTAPQFASFAVAGSHLYAYDGNQNLLEVFNFNPAAGNFSFVNSFVVPGPSTLFYAGLAVAPDESYIYVTVPDSDSVVVLDAAKVMAGDTTALVTSFATGLSPEVVALSPKRRDTAPEDVAITISHTPEPVVLGNTITYNVTLTDFGPFPGSGNGDSGGDSGGFLINLDKSLVLVSSTFFNSQFLGCSLTGTQLLCEFGHGGPDLGPPPVSISGNLVLRTTVLGAVTVQGYIQAGKNSYDPNSANNTATDTANVASGVVAPAIAKTFGAASIPLNGSTSLTFTIQNNNTASTLTGVGFSDTMPTGLVISTPNGLTGTCGGGTISATLGTNVISLTGATLAQNSSCTFSVNVTGVLGAVAGTQINTTGNVTSTEGGTGGTASASIDVVVPPSIAKAFNPTTIALNGATTLTFTITNPAANAVAETGVAFTDTLPAGLVVATPNGLTSTCGGTATAVEGSGSISLTGGPIATGSNCTITANVTATSFGNYTNTTGNVSSTNGGTGNTASANLSVATPPAITKAFGAASIPLNGSTSLTFTITNPETNSIALTGVAFTDNLPAGLVVATPNALASTCGGTATAVAGASSLSLAGATLATNTSCTISANVTGTAARLKNNSVQVTATESGAGNTSNASVTVIAADLAVTMTAAPASVAPGSNLTYTITVTNNGPSDSTGYTVTDTLPSSVTFVSATSGCVLTTVLTCSGPSLGSGLTATYVVVVTPTTLGTLSNTASVTGNDPDPVPGNNSATTTTSVAAVDLGVTKTASASPAALGANLTYTITVTNNGPSASTGYTVTDTLPSTVTFVSATAGCLLSSGVVTCTGSSLGVGLNAIYVVVVTPTALGTLSNTASVTGNEPDPVPGNNSATSTVTVVTALADVAVTMTASPSPVAVLGSVTYQITLTNNGPSPATGVVLTDTLPAGTLFAGIDDLTDCAVSNGVLTCTFAPLAAGSNITVNLILVPLTVPVDPDTFDNTATVAANEPDPALSNNSATQTVQVTGANLSGGGALRNLPGFSNTITLPNDDDSFGPVPLGFNLNFFGAQVSSLFVNNNGNVTFGSPLGTYTPFPITTTNLQIIAPYFSDVGTYQTGSGLVTYGTDTVNGRPAFGVNWPNVDYFGEGAPDLLNLFQLVLVDRSDVNAGDFDIELNYDKIQWETGDASGGSGGLGGTPARVGYSNGTGSSGSFFEFPGSGVSGSFLDSNTATGLIYNTLNSTQPGRYIFQVRGGVVQSSADMAITATGPQFAAAGSTVTYALTAANSGPNTATGVTVTDTLPVGLTFVSATPGTICPTPPVPAAGQPVVVTCNVGSIASGSTVDIAIQATIAPGVSGLLTDTAVISAPNNQDLNLGNNTATVVTNTNVADLAVSMSPSATQVAPGSNLTYTITVTNNGPSASIGYTLTDTLPSIVSFVSAAGCSFSTGVVTCTGSSLNAGQSANYLVVVTPTAQGTVSNTASVSGTEPDLVPANNSATVTVTAIAVDLAVGMNASPTIVAPGSNLTYTITVTNNGPSASTGYTLTDTLPSNVTFVGASSSTGCTGATTTVTCTGSALGVGQSATFIIVVTPTAQATLTNTASVTGNEPDPVPGNNSATLQNFAETADIVVSAAGAPSPVGGFPAYAVTVANNGPADATNVVFTDQLDNYGFVSASSTQGSCTFTAPTVTCSVGALANGASAVVTVVVTAPNAGWAANTFHASAAQPDPNPINNSVRLGPPLDSFNTPVGSNVTINTSDPADNLIALTTFSTVTRIGSTTMASMSATSPPPGFRSGLQPTFFDISTNAEYVGAIALNIRFLPANFRHPAHLRLFHFEGGTWVDRTTGLNASSGVIAGQAMSLSPFALLEPVDTIPVANAGGDRSVPGAMAAGARVTLDGSASVDADGDPLTYRWSGPFPEGGGTVTGVNPTVTLPLGVSKVSLVVNDGEADSPAVAVNVAVADFQVSAPAGSVALNRGQSTTFTITMTPQYGAFGAPINLSCAPGAADVTCSFSSTSVTPGATATTATLTVTAVSTVARAPGRSMPAYIALWLGTLPVFGVVFLAAGRRKKWQMAVLLTLLLVLVASHIGCGGGGTSRTQSSSQSTPGAKAISITVTGTSGTLQHSSSVTVTIPQ